MRAIYRGILCAAFLAWGLQAASITLGNPARKSTGSCDPFGCAVFFNLGTYQQVYLGSAFPGAVEITQLTFSDPQVNNRGERDDGTYTLSLAYTKAAPGGLNLQNPGGNASGGSQTFFSGMLPRMATGPNGSRLLAIQGTPFHYDPANGNLLLTITVSDATDQTPHLYLNVAQTMKETGNAYFPTSGKSGGNEPGLVTEFTVGPQAKPAAEHQ